LIADRELDALVAEKVMGWHEAQTTFNGLWWCVEGDGSYFGRRQARVSEWHPSTNIADAWQVVEKMRADAWDVLIDGTDDGSCDWWTVRFGGCMPAVQSTSIAKAICLAALKAKGVEVSE
jgi:hypothetical protein